MTNRRTFLGLTGSALAGAALAPLDAMGQVVSLGSGFPVKKRSSCNTDTDKGELLSAFVNGVSGRGGVRAGFYNTGTVKWGGLTKVLEVSPGCQYHIIGMTEEPFPKFLATSLRLHHSMPTSLSDGVCNPQAVWERLAYSPRNEVTSHQDPDSITLYFRREGATLSARDLDSIYTQGKYINAVALNNFQNPTDYKMPAGWIKTRQDIPLASDVDLVQQGETWMTGSLASPQTSLDDILWLGEAVWANGDDNLITVRQKGRGTGNDGSLKGPVSNGAGLYEIKLFDARGGDAKHLLTAEIDMGGRIVNGEYFRDSIPFTRTYVAPDAPQDKDLFVGRNLLQTEGAQKGHLDNWYKVSTSNADWARGTNIVRGDVDKRMRPIQYQGL